MRTAAAIEISSAQLFPERLGLAFVEHSSPQQRRGNDHAAMAKLKEVQGHDRARRDQRQKRCLKTCERQKRHLRNLPCLKTFKTSSSNGKSVTVRT